MNILNPFKKNKNNKPIPKHFHMKKERLEALTDGVFAILMTLIVFEIKVPKISLFEINNPVALWSELANYSSLFIAYIVTFAVLAMFWLNHHFVMYVFAKNINRVFIQLNVIFLAILSFIPFSSGLLGNYLGNPLAVGIFGFNILLVGMMSYTMFLYIIHSSNIENKEVNSKTITKRKIRHQITIFATLLGILMCFVNSQISLLLYIIPVFFNNIPGALSMVEKIFDFEIE
jgi:uncharacterized membrane protein